MKLSDFDYELPPERIAQEPATRRDAARLFVHEIGRDRSFHRHVRDLPELLRSGDLLVLNDTRVLPVRLFGRRRSGAEVELLLLGPEGQAGAWKALVRPSRRLQQGEELELEGGALRASLLGRALGPDGVPLPEWSVRLFDAARSGSAAGDDTIALLERHGHMPLPPYIRRPRSRSPLEDVDRDRYQTVFADRPGAVAAPTAGLHFTDELFARLEEAGVERAFVTLHVGAGTFLPVQSEDVEQHRMHSERFELTPEAAAKIESARTRGGRIVAVGTTSLRVLESSVDAAGRLVPGAGTTDLFIRPGSTFHAVDCLLTNFHLPRSTLLMLVSALAGRERTLRLYAEAIGLGYRFYSYGDAMLFTR